MGATRGSERGGDKPKKHKDRGVKFNERHTIKYGLSVCSRNAKTSIVESVMCKFCVAFGKESAADATRKRRATANIKYFRQPFRADHYLSHLEINHKQKWAEYEQSTNPEKEKFFAAHIEEATINSLAMAQQQLINAQTGSASCTGTVVGTATPVVQRVGPVRLPASVIEKRMVEEIVGGMFFNASDEDGVSKDQALDVFRRKNDTDTYEIVIKNQRLYDLAIKFVACGASFRLASRMVQCTKEETKMAYYGGCSDNRVAGYVRAVIASNLQKIALMMRSSWAYAIATDAAVHQGTSYLDIRIRLWQNRSLHDFHLLTVPAFDKHPAPSIMERLEKFFDIMDAQWRSKLLGTTTNGGANTGRNTGVTGSQQGLSARLTTAVNKPAFYLIWCGVHQLELVVKNCVSTFCQKAFYDELVSVLAALRQDQQSSHQEGSLSLFENEIIPDVTTAFATTRGFSEKLMQALKWLMEHRLAIMQLRQTASPASVPSASWWVCVAVAHRVMAEIVYFMNKLLNLESGPNKVRGQVQELCKLALIMADVIGARRDLWESPDRQEACAAGSFQLTFQNAQQFIQNEGGPLAIEVFDTLGAVERLHGRHYCTEDVGVHVNPPIAMPIEVCEMGQEAFLQILSEQEPRLRETLSDDDIKTIQSEYEEFVLAVNREPILSGVMKKHDRDTDVSFAWSCVNGRFRRLQEFVGGLVSVVPDMSAGTLASDLTRLNWEKPDYRQTMIDFALEGILHAKQKYGWKCYGSTPATPDVDLVPPHAAAASLTAASLSAGCMQTSMITQDIANLSGVPMVMAKTGASNSSELLMPIGSLLYSKAVGFFTATMRATQLLPLVLALLCLHPACFVLAKEVFTGKATTYGLESALGGSCSARMAPYGLNSSLFVAMNYDQYYESSSCNRCLSITGESGTVTAFVADLCYECGYGNLDLNTALWYTVVGGDPRISEISWHFTPCPDEQEKFCWKEGSNPQWFALQVPNSRDGIKAMEINGVEGEVIGVTSFYQVSPSEAIDMENVDVKITSNQGITSKATLKSSDYNDCPMTTTLPLKSWHQWWHHHNRDH
ncbi:RlpA-like double-psi beta-barrel domain [Phytophthora cactorum]|nr:RlpA-like double-psi beta-barrel domain [Phytophthora cactorum]